MSASPACRAWSLQLCNDWMGSLDDRYHRTNVHEDTPRVEPDGRVRIVVALPEIRA